MTSMEDITQKYLSKVDIGPRKSNRIRKSKHSLSAEDLNVKDNHKRKSKRFQCSVCKTNKPFTTQKQLNRHIQRFHIKKEEEIICEICSQKLMSEKYFKRHLTTRHPERPKAFICDFEGRSFASKDYIRIHMDRHRKHQILTCTICQKSYISKHTFRRHLKMHIEKHVCSCCGLVFNQKLLLENHHASKHSNELPYKCQFCTRLFPSKTARNNHNYITHRSANGELKFKCNECNIHFEMKEELRIHSFIHFTGEIKTCLECDQIFKTNRLLKIHMQKHENKKSFQCAVCHDEFTFKTGLSKHIRLNRCRGPKSQKELTQLVDELEESVIVKIAMQQLNEITKTSKKLVKVKEEKWMDDWTEPESEDNFIESPKFSDVEIKTEVDKEEVKEEVKTKKTRKIRKKKQCLPVKHKAGRAHLIYTCDICGDSIKFKKEILNHMRQHANVFKYKCKECENYFKSRRKLIDHLWTVHRMKPRAVLESFSCEVCDMKFDVKSIYEAHKMSHDDTARSHVCLTCGAAFKSTGNLRRHEAIHVATRDFHCPNCPKTFKTQLALKVHGEAVHASVKIFVNCSECKVIVQEKHLKIHMKNQHSEIGKEKPFSCTTCGKTFKTEKLGQRHYEAVHDPKPQGVIYECAECPGLQFYRQRALKEHSFLHFDGVIHQCEICLKMFKSRRLLLTHSVVHKEENDLYPCLICENVVFKTKGGRSKHMVRLHREQPEQRKLSVETQFTQ